MRRIAHREFTPRRIADMRDSIQRYTDELLDDLERAGESDSERSRTGCRRR